MISEPEALRIPYQGSVVRTHKRFHLAAMAVLMIGHTIIHYAILIPEVGELVEDLPFFNLHVLHEAEYLAVVAYASLVFRLRGGVLALLAMSLASIPFLLAFKINSLEYVEYGFSGPDNALIDFVVLLVIGAWFVTVNELWGRERDRRILSERQLEVSNEALRQANQQVQEANRQLEQANDRLESVNHQLTVLNQTIQTQLTRLFGTLNDLTDRELHDVEGIPVSSLQERYKRFIEEVKRALG